MTVGELRGLAALITGGSAGIGAAIARAFVAEAASVAILDLQPPSREDLIDGARFVAADVADGPAVASAVAQAVDTLGGIDIVVNNAGIGATGSVADSSDEQWHSVLEVNVVGTARVCREAWPHLRRSRHAAIVNITSIAATTGLPDRAVYSASKGAVLGLTLAMAADGIAEGIRVNSISPGTTDTQWVRRLLASAADPAAERAALEARQPHGRLIRPEEIAHAAVYLASPRSGSTTGAEIAVDGGLSGLRLRARS